jgi:hypothetical protein
MWNNNINDVNDRPARGEKDGRTLWERPAIRRLAANCAESAGPSFDDGLCNGGIGGHSCKM